MCASGSCCAHAVRWTVGRAYRIGVAVELFPADKVHTEETTVLGTHVNGRGTVFRHGKHGTRMYHSAPAVCVLSRLCCARPRNVNLHLGCYSWQVKPGHLVFDPFCGTASLLVSAAALGARTMGSDIDMLVLKGMLRGNRKKDGNVFTNFAHYGLQPPEIIRFDSSVRWDGGVVSVKVARQHV